MPAKPNAHLYLVCGSEEYLVKENARRLVKSLAPKGGAEFAVEIVDGTVTRADEAVKAIYRVLEAVNTMGFFSSEKLIWLKDANFFGTDKTSEAAIVKEAAGELAEVVKKGLPTGVTLIVSAAEMDKRRAFYLACNKLGEVAVFDAIDPTKDRDWEGKVTDFIAAHARALDKTVSRQAIAQLVELNGANLRQIETELEKIAAYVGDRGAIEPADVRAVGSASREAIAWDLNDAVGHRDLGKALRLLDRLLFQGEEVIGLLFAIASRVRQMLILRELVDRKLLRPGGEYFNMKGQLDRLPASIRDEMPADRKLNPLLQHPFPVFKTLQQAANFTRPQLIRAMEWLLETNQQLVTSSLPDRLTLEELLARIITVK
ncbi:MAG: DNA polymerase III subunit delta [Verrucomicrobia bacterium]|nr:DNA polymerase III subunit delta [Verrucomicrobiota bacterium]